MFIASKNHILIPGADGRNAVRIPRGYVGNVPDWVGGTDYFKALVKCGKIELSEGKKAASRNSSPKPAKGKRASGTPGREPAAAPSTLPPETGGTPPAASGGSAGAPVGDS